MKHIILAVSGAILVIWGFLALRGDRSEPDQAGSSVNTEALVEKERVLQFWRYYREATSHRLAGRWREAQLNYINALKLNPHHQDALYYLGNVYMDQGMFEEAESMWLDMVRLDSSSARAYSQLGTLYACYENQNRFDLEAARQAYLRAFEINKEETGPLLRLGQIALLRQEWESAASYFDDVIGSNHKSLEALTLNGYVAWRQGDANKAGTLLEEAISISNGRAGASMPSGEGDTRKGNVPMLLERTRCEPFKEHLEELSTYTNPVLPDQVSEYYLELDGIVRSYTQKRD